MEPRALRLDTPGIAQSAGQLQPYKLDEIADIGGATYGNVSQITDKFTALARTGDIDEVGKSLDNLLLQAKQYDPTKLRGNPLGQFFGMTIQKVRSRYQTVDQGVDQLVGEIKNRIVHFQQRVPELEALYQANEDYKAELTRVMDAANERIAWMEANLPVVEPGNVEQAQNLDNWNQTIAYAKKRVDDLRRVQILAEQQGPQIKLMALNSATLSQKFTAIESTVIPALKQAFTLYIINVEQEKGAAFANKVDDAFEAAVLANSKKLKTNTISIHKALARPTLQLTTLQTSQKNLVDSITEVRKIREGMVAQIATERPQLEALSRELATQLGAPKTTTTALGPR